jgi:hypothetical protein
MIEVVEGLARFEDRWAVDVLNDLLAQPADAGPSNGPGAGGKLQPVRK